eukprot:CAMPEP_0116060038 /NCGR_PEP_ID=MMETSP0322-20121206/6166_1 /TAXON_ID=163516 /ORGANISM="Leptocylindrus danicus var. apora, Strain B651" /LENGTH=1023 /DNA_ID=CAMNT_0003544559 /DNA_START=108 /DNA_END=3176 /DNA_ORIENTATION=-
MEDETKRTPAVHPSSTQREENESKSRKGIIPTTTTTVPNAEEREDNQLMDDGSSSSLRRQRGGGGGERVMRKRKQVSYYEVGGQVSFSKSQRRQNWGKVGVRVKKVGRIKRKKQKKKKFGGDDSTVVSSLYDDGASIMSEWTTDAVADKEGEGKKDTTGDVDIDRKLKNYFDSIPTPSTSPSKKKRLNLKGDFEPIQQSGHGHIGLSFDGDYIPTSPGSDDLDGYVASPKKRAVKKSQTRSTEDKVMSNFIDEGLSYKVVNDKKKRKKHQKRRKKKNTDEAYRPEKDFSSDDDFDDFLFLKRVVKKKHQKNKKTVDESNLHRSNVPFDRDCPSFESSKDVGQAKKHRRRRRSNVDEAYKPGLDSSSDEDFEVGNQFITMSKKRRKNRYKKLKEVEASRQGDDANGERRDSYYEFSNKKGMKSSSANSDRAITSTQKVCKSSIRYDCYERQPCHDENQCTEKEKAQVNSSLAGPVGVEVSSEDSGGREVDERGNFFSLSFVLSILIGLSLLSAQLLQQAKDVALHQSTVHHNSSHSANTFMYDVSSNISAIEMAGTPDISIYSSDSLESNNNEGDKSNVNISPDFARSEISSESVEQLEVQNFENIEEKLKLYLPITENSTEKGANACENSIESDVFEDESNAAFSVSEGSGENSTFSRNMKFRWENQWKDVLFTRIMIGKLREKYHRSGGSFGDVYDPVLDKGKSESMNLFYWKEVIFMRILTAKLLAKHIVKQKIKSSDGPVNVSGLDVNGDEDGIEVERFHDVHDYILNKEESEFLNLIYWKRLIFMRIKISKLYDEYLSEHKLNLSVESSDNVNVEEVDIEQNSSREIITQENNFDFIETRNIASFDRGARIMYSGPYKTSESLSDELPLINRLLSKFGRKFYGLRAETAIASSKFVERLDLGKCWSFLVKEKVTLPRVRSVTDVAGGLRVGSIGTLAVKIPAKSKVQHVAIAHPLTKTSQPQSAIKDFRVLGFENDCESEATYLGSFMFDIANEDIQVFSVIDVNKAFSCIVLAIDSNW